MRPIRSLVSVLLGVVAVTAAVPVDQAPLLTHANSNRTVSPALFAELEELARIVDISYCVGLTGLGIAKPFSCLSRCSDFPAFELVTTWNTGPLMSDSCGYIAIDHDKQRVIIAFRGTYSIANTVVDLSTIPQEYAPYNPGQEQPGDTTHHEWIDNEVRTASEEKCNKCTVHSGFHASWLITRKAILPQLQGALLLYPNYHLTLVGHSLGGAVAALAGLDLQARGYQPTITTFGEPRIGNAELVDFLDSHFGLNEADGIPEDDTNLQYRRVTHIDDPVPLLPLSEWGYAMHAGEIYISKPALSPDIADTILCEGDNDQTCIAQQDSTVQSETSSGFRRRDLISSVQDEIHDVVHEPWGIPSRYKLWQLFFAHRDYFHRLGLCVPGGDPLGGGSKYGGSRED